MVLLLYCMPFAACYECRRCMAERHGGPRSTERVRARPEVGPEHEAESDSWLSTSEENDGRVRRWEPSGQLGCHPRAVRHTIPPLRVACTSNGPGGLIDIEPTVEANGNKPISPLSVAAELHCVSENELQLGRRFFAQTA